MTSTAFIPSSAPDGLELAFHHWPAQSPRAGLSLIHGFGEHSGRYGAMAAYLNTQNISVLAVDLRGHGLTQSPRGVCRAYAELLGDVDALAAHAHRLYPALPHYLMGHSMGGGLALAFGLEADKDAFEGYLVSAPFLKSADHIPAPLKFTAKLMSIIAPRLAINFPIDGTKISSLKAEQEAYLSDPLVHGRLSFGLAAGMTKTGEDILARAQNWAHPLSLWYAPEDQLTDFEAIDNFAARAPHCRKTIFKGVEHEMHNDTARQSVYALITDFILKEPPA